MSRKTIEQLREYMSQSGIDVWMVASADYHDSEYLGEYFKLRSYLSGFTGSAGTLVVTAQEAGLWTDGRYFVQAARELKDSGITLYKSGQKGILSIPEFLEEKIPAGGCIGFDGRTVGQTFYLELKERLEKKQVRFSLFEDLGGKVWTDRPALSCEKIWLLDEKYSGMSTEEKIQKVRSCMKEAGASVHLLTCLDNIAWLYNIRGADVSCNPVALSYAAITMTEAVLFIQEAAVTDEVRKMLNLQGITLKPYEAIYDYTEAIKETETVMLDESRMNCALYAKLPKNVRILNQVDPETLLKAVKNPVEQENIRKAHIKDGVAMVKFIYWLKKNIGKIPITERSAGAYIDQKRSEQEGFLDLSFPTIAAYGSNAAMCHYSATEETDTALKPEGFFLVDSGGQYMEGTTDITRTIVMGPLTDKQKLHYTLVLKGMIRLAAAHFLHGCSGSNLDILVRSPLWQYGLDYNHGTGHGVGYLLSVHEDPTNINWNRKRGAAVIEPGMLTSDEPGLYLEDEYGIRTENLLICRETQDNEFGTFLDFETVTMVPIDTEAIDISLMTSEELEWLNQYHETVYNTISPLVEPEEAAWLKEACRRI